MKMMLERMADQIATFAVSDSSPEFQGEVREMALKCLRDARQIQRHQTCIMKVVRGWSPSSAGFVVYRNMDLPFAPFVGLIVRDGLFYGNISKVTYDAISSSFVCWTPENCCRSDDDVDTMVNELLRSGWELDRSQKPN